MKGKDEGNMSAVLLEINDLAMISKYKEKVKGFIMGYNTFTSLSAHYFNYEEIAKATQLSNNIYICLNELIHNDRQDEFKNELTKLNELGVHFIIQDLGGCLIAKDCIGLDKVIFNPYTLLTNSKDASIYASLGFEGIIISSEITAKDMNTISSLIDNCGCLLFGYHPMYQTYRHIIDLYKSNNNLIFDNDGLTLKEFTRSEKYHVLDHEHGSVTFRPYIVSLFKVHDEITNFKYQIFDTIFLNN